MIMRKTLSAGFAAGITAAAGMGASGVAMAATSQITIGKPTATPIKHLVVIYGENISFDHYFATYPNATNPNGEPVFTAKSSTPAGIATLQNANLLTNNPNFTNPANGTNAAEPFRLDRSQASTADQGHSYTPEQQAYDNGLADLFPLYTGAGTTGGAGAFGTKGQVMGYYDGNTVTAMWNLAQNFAMSDNSYSDTYGPSTPGALEAISGQNNGLQLVASSKSSYYVTNADGSLTLINDVDPGFDTCSSTSNQASMTGKNIGDLLNATNITWGSFMGGFDLSAVNANASTGCTRSTFSQTVNQTVNDYVAHHAWFQYYASTANPAHARPSSTSAIGRTYEPGLQNGQRVKDPANHEYDISDFYSAVQANNLPAVSYLKAPAYEDAHAGYSDPLDEQAFVAQVVNTLEQSPDWRSTAVVVAYDDSDGWYDHSYATPTQASFDSVADQLNGAGICGAGTQPAGLSGAPVNGRCGPGTRQPFLVISPWAKVNYVSHVQISQASIVQFIEDNWLQGQRIGDGSLDAKTGSIMDMFDFTGTAKASKVYLDPNSGLIVRRPPSN